MCFYKQNHIKVVAIEHFKLDGTQGKKSSRERTQKINNDDTMWKRFLCVSKTKQSLFSLLSGQKGIHTSAHRSVDRWSGKNEREENRWKMEEKEKLSYLIKTQNLLLNDFSIGFKCNVISCNFCLTLIVSIGQIHLYCRGKRE